jgi:hypothetical protein
MSSVTPFRNPLGGGKQYASAIVATSNLPLPDRTLTEQRWNEAAIDDEAQPAKQTSRFDNHTKEISL